MNVKILKWEKKVLFLNPSKRIYPHSGYIAIFGQVDYDNYGVSGRKIYDEKLILKKMLSLFNCL